METRTFGAVAIQNSVAELNSMIQQGQVLEAFDKFYAVNVTMQENENEPTEGKEACRLNEIAFVNGITEFRKAEIKNVVISDGVSVVEWHFDFTHADWGIRNYVQVSVQRWNQDGQIINEKFYYNN